MGADRLHRCVERMRDEGLRVALQGLVGDRADVIAGRERSAGAGDHDAPGLDSLGELGQGGRERVEDLMVERIALLGIRERQSGDRLGGTIEDQLAGGERLAHRPHRLLEHDQHVTFLDALALLAADLLDRAVVLDLDRHLHLHRLEDDHGVPVRDLVADLDLDLPDGAGDMCLNVCHRRAGEYPAAPDP